MKKLLHLTLMAVVLACTTVAGAQSISQDKLTAARKSFRAGKKKLEAGDYEGALVEYRIADAVVKKPSSRLGVARALVGLGRLVEAGSVARSVAKLPAPPDEHPTLIEARKEAAALAKKLKRRIPRLRLSVTPADAEVMLDKKRLSPAQYRNILIDPGKHTLVARAKGYKVLRRSFKAYDRKKFELELDLARSDRESDIPSEADERDESDGAIDGELIGGISLLAVGAAFFSTGIVGMTNVDSVNKDDTFQNFRRANPQADNVCDLAFPGSNESDLCSKMRTGELMQLVSFPFAAAAAGVGIALIVMSPTVAGGDEPSASSRLKIFPVLSPQHQGAGLHYSF